MQGHIGVAKAKKCPPSDTKNIFRSFFCIVLIANDLWLLENVGSTPSCPPENREKERKSGFFSSFIRI